MKKIVFMIPLLLALVGCNHSYDANTVAAVQPCMAQGYNIDQCVATYHQFGQSYANNNEWINYAAAFAAGAAANHFWNRNQYAYNPNYWDTHPRVTYNNTTIYQGAPAQQSAPQQRQSIGYVQPAQAEKTLVINKQELISNQKVQPLFKPNVIAPNLATQPAQQAANPAFQPIQVQAPKAQTSGFAPIQVQTPKVSTPAFQPAKSAPVAKAPAFKPVQVAKPKK